MNDTHLFADIALAAVSMTEYVVIGAFAGALWAFLDMFDENFR